MLSCHCYKASLLSSISFTFKWNTSYLLLESIKKKPQGAKDTLIKKCNPLLYAYFQCKKNSRQWIVFLYLPLWWNFKTSDIINETCHYLEALRKWVLCECELESCKCKHPHVKLQDALCKLYTSQIQYFEDYGNVSC